jgi:hypothetical protein
MPADPVLSRELTSLREQLSLIQRERTAEAEPARTVQTTSEAVAVGTRPPLAPAPPERSEDEQRLQEQLSDLADEITNFFEHAEKNISEHPIESVAGALLIGILIGRLLGRR